MRSASRWLLGALVVATGLLVVPACTDRDEFPADTARVEFPQRRIDLSISACGRDEDLDVFALGATSSDTFVQLLLVIDGDRVDVDASGLTVDVRGDAVYGAGDAALLQVPPGSPGVIESASIRGDRIDLEADALPLSSGPLSSGPLSSGGATPAGESIRIELTARCTAVDDLALAGGGMPSG